MNAAAGDVVSFPEGNTPLLPNELVVIVDRVLATPAQARGHEPDRFVQGSWHDGGSHAGEASARSRSRVCVDREHFGVAGRVRKARRHAAFVLVPAGKVAPGKLQQTLAYGARTLAVRG